MDNYAISQHIKYQLETLLLEAILSVLEKITAHIAEMKEEPEDKF